MRRITPHLPAGLVAALVLAACAVPTPTSSPSTQASPTAQSVASVQRATQTPNTIVITDTAASTSTATAQNDLNEDQTRTDEQGAVVIKVKPLNLSNPGETLDFDVALETHSVDLSMDLVALATLTTDNGHSVPAAKWDGPVGGHHVEGKLLFPAKQDGAPVTEGAIQLTLTLRNVDVPERIFTWDLK